MKTIALASLLLGGTLAMAHAADKTPIQARTVEYKDDGTVLEGYLARPERAPEGKLLPGVIVVHEWYGLNDYAKRRADEIARLGYIALAADVYGKGVRAKNNEEAAKLAGTYRGGDRENLRARMRAALDFLRRQPGADGKRIAAIGYCFGGSAVLELARDGADVAGVVSFHGGLSTPRPAQAGTLKAKVLALHGADDPFVPADEVAAFQEEMRKSGADWQFVAYGGAVHSFTNPAAGNDNAKGAAYNADADRRSWEAMSVFLEELFGPAHPPR